MHMKVYVDTDLDICLARRLSRDTITRGRDLEGAIGQWESFVKPNAEKSVKPTMRNADLIVPRGSENTIAIDMLIKHIKKQLIKKSEMHLDKLDKLTGKLEISSQKFPNLKRLDRSDQLRGVYTVLLNKETSRADFIFYFDRIATNLINKALEFQTFEKTCLITPLNIRFEGVLPSDQIIAVSIIRSGDCFMHSLRKTIPEVPIGKLLIQSDSTTGEPRLHTEALPPCIDEANTKVLLLDAQIISGAAVIMATQVLVDHGVKPENIVLVTYLATEIGLGRLLKAFKGIKVVVGEIGFREDLIRQSWFRTRFIDAKYFGTA
ncbi:hypothetical protein WICMUC_003652 [Wickerhamomyces mucosus]|uniref:uridine/cytidine kinase n=1 Tax=Wickerhamomyces mucosus TaxID=1378264 RepID=A0A9P8PL64_9ASCO|nr:hypothetical protein WICMUC_003652 [Wickerhamomyces mucosus]